MANGRASFHRLHPVVTTILSGVLLFSVMPPRIPPSYAQQPDAVPPAALPPCSPGVIVSASSATVASAAATLKPGPLFADSGYFAEKPVDTPCDPGKQIGPFPVDAGGKLVVRLRGDPPAPNQWSLHNNGTSVNIVYEPLYGNEYGPGQGILSLAIPAEQTEIEGGAEWPGPGRLSAHTGAPGGSGPLTYSCFEQSYTVQADIVEVFPNAPAVPGTTLLNGAQIVTDGNGYAHIGLLAGGVPAGAALVGPNSDLTLSNGSAGVDPAAVAQAGQLIAAGRTCGKAVGMDGSSAAQGGQAAVSTDDDWKQALKNQAMEWYRSGLPEPEGFWENPDKYWDGFDADEWEKLRAAAQSNSDPLVAAVELKLAAEAYHGSSENVRQKARLSAFQNSRGWTEEQIAQRQEQARQEIAVLNGQLNELRGKIEENSQDYEAAKEMGRVLRKIGEAEWEIRDLDNYRLPVLHKDPAAVKWEEKDLYPYKRDLQKQAYEWAEAGMPMPDGYRDDPSRFWADYQYEIMELALEGIREEQDPCEALLRFKFFMEGEQGQWTSRNAGGRAADLGADVLLIWLPPNGYDALKTLLRDALGVTTPVGQAVVFGAKALSAAKNTKATYDRLLKEIAMSAAALRAKRMESEIRITKGYELQEVMDRKRKYEEEISQIQEEVKDLSVGFSLEYARLANELKPLDTWENTIKSWISPWDVDKAVKRMDLRIQMQELRDDFEGRVRQKMDRMLELQTYHAALVDYRLPVLQGGCEALRVKEQPLPPSPWACAGKKTVELVLKKGFVRISEAKAGPIGKFVAETLVVLGEKEPVPVKIEIKPDGTDYSVEKKDDSAVVRVFDGAVTVTASDGLLLTVTAGEQAALPDGVVSSFDLALDSTPHTSSAPQSLAGLVSGLRLRDVPVDSSVPEPYGLHAVTSADGQLAPGWVWQDTDPNYSGIQDAILEMPSPEEVRVTVPNGNEFAGHMSYAPRLLHKVTGDFDLETEMQLECEGRHFAASSFIIFTPGVPLGYLYGNMRPESLPAQYYTVGGGRSLWADRNKLSVVNRPWEEGPDAPDGPVRVKMSRRGDVLKTYWSTNGGETWTLDSRHVLPMPATLWAGWLFRRIAHDGLNDKAAFTTLRDVTLKTAPLDTMPDDDWDVVDFAGRVDAFGTELGMGQDGSNPSYVQAYSPWTIPGDFDLVVRYGAPPVDDQPDQERWVTIGVSANDGKDYAYVGNAVTPDQHRYVCDMSINGGWYRWREAPTTEDTGRLRLARQDGHLTGYYWQDNDWVALSKWNDDFSNPLYLDLRFHWKTPNPSVLQTARFSIERLETPDGVWIGPADEMRPVVTEPPSAAQPGGFFGADATAAPEIVQPTAESAPLVQPTAAFEQPTPALPLPAEPPGIAEFSATPPEVAPGQWVTLSWRTSGGEPHLFRVDASGQPKPESSDVLKADDWMEVPIDGNAGDEVTFALGVLSDAKDEWLATKTVKVKIVPPSPAPPVLPTLPLPADPSPPPPSPASVPQATLGPFTFSSDFDESTAQSVNVGQTFPAGTLKIWVSWAYSGFPAGTPYQYEWYRDGQLFAQGQYQFWQSSGASWTWVTGKDQSSLPPGTYAFVLHLAGQRYDVGQVVVEASSAP